MEWLRANAALIAATALLVATMTFIRWELTGSIISLRNELTGSITSTRNELTARIETSEAKMNTIRVELLAEFKTLQRQIDQLTALVTTYLNRNIELEVQTRENTRRIETLEKRIETR